MDACWTEADGHAERIAALHRIEPRLRDDRQRRRHLEIEVSRIFRGRPLRSAAGRSGAVSRRVYAASTSFGNRARL